MSYYVHQVPGRLRIKSPSIKGNPKEAVAVEDLLQSMDGIKTTAVNTLTGSVVVNYDSRMVTDQKILSRLTELGHFNPAQAKTSDEYLQGAFSTAGEIVWKAFFGSFVDTALAGTPISFISVLI
jgi:copper chaperone CopZ